MTIREAAAPDLPPIGAIQAASPQAAQWDVADYLKYNCYIAIDNETVAGFVVVRQVAAGETEILNIAVAPERRRQGIGGQLLGEILARHRGEFFLEVRESNSAARQFYEKLGFRPITRRPQYYYDPSESAIVMKLYSCYGFW